ncbi:pentapeptide repeat-containing protein [Streptomyces sp. NPDC006476]|uniref:pentapeptide repeat-containing protein n=1 Tax=Streptomyces sp. NPDC006476 TaxID=3157175 RepID=UPI0033A386CB
MRPLLDLVATECTGEPATEDCGLIAIDPVAACSLNLEAHAAAEIDAGRVHRTASDLAAAGHGLQLLLFVRGVHRGDRRDLWAIDGWQLLRTAGAKADLSHADLRGARLVGAQLAGADLSETDLRGADLSKADLSGAALVGADLSGADLYRASLLEADLTEADLRRAFLKHTDLQRAVCVRASLRGADVADSYFWEVDISQTFLEGVELERASNLEGRRVGTAAGDATSQAAHGRGRS